MKHQVGFMARAGFVVGCCVFASCATSDPGNSGTGGSAAGNSGASAGRGGAPAGASGSAGRGGGIAGGSGAAGVAGVSGSSGRGGAGAIAGGGGSGGTAAGSGGAGTSGAGGTVGGIGGAGGRGGASGGSGRGGASGGTAGGGAAGSGGRGGAGGASCGVPTSFQWSSTGVVLSPKSDATHNLVSIKDPSIVYFNNKWHVFVSTVDVNGVYSMAYVTFPSWERVGEATFYHLDQTPTLRGYTAAPEIFFFAPQNRWYLIFQAGPPRYSTNDNIENPAGWSAQQDFYASEPATVTQNKGTGAWLDFWVICDDANCYMFFSDGRGHWYRARTTVANFPRGFGEPAIVIRDDANPTRVFEASNVYKLTGTNKYLALIEAFDASSNNRRYFRSWTADALDGAWTPLADTFANAFASGAGTTFSQQPPWTQNISHGDMIRDGTDQHLTVDPCHMQYLYQGFDPASEGAPYNSLPWKLGLLTKTN